MRLGQKAVKPGDWIKIKDASPGPFQMSKVHVGDRELAAYVEGDDLLVRCPRDAKKGTTRVAVEGKVVGSVIVQ